MTRVLVCGGRGYEDRKAVWSTLATVHAESPITLVITGGAQGADRLAEGWAAERHIPLMVFPAHWHRMGKRAGPMRNGWMLQFGQPDLVLAFPGGRGTHNMIEQARIAGAAVVSTDTGRAG